MYSIADHKSVKLDFLPEFVEFGQSKLTCVITHIFVFMSEGILFGEKMSL